MAASNHTPLGFNQWISTDKPLRADFNADNALAEAEFQKRLSLTPPATWVPRFEGFTTPGALSYTRQSGIVSVTGSTVDCWGNFTGVITELGSGQMVIRGFPYVNTIPYVPVNLYNVAKLSSDSNGTIYGYMRANQNYILLAQKYPDKAYTTPQLSNLAIGATIDLVFHVRYLK